MLAAVVASTASTAGDSSALLAASNTPLASCSVAVTITGATGEEGTASDTPQCFSAPAEVRVTGDDVSSVVVWDTEVGICGDRQLYVHYVSASAATMTAGAGALKHTYKACAFDSVPVSGVGCQTFSGTGCRSVCDTREWEVARAGSSC